jgi:hypothetical protein
VLTISVSLTGHGRPSSTCYLRDLETLSRGVAEIRRELTIPVICPSMDDPKMDEEAIKKGKTDLAGMARGLLADPFWANKVAAGKKPVKCIRCGTCWQILIELSWPLSVSLILNSDMNSTIRNTEPYRRKGSEKLPEKVASTKKLSNKDDFGRRR